MRRNSEKVVRERVITEGWPEELGKEEIGTTVDEKRF
jgi:hypothetical protein